MNAMRPSGFCTNLANACMWCASGIVLSTGSQFRHEQIERLGLALHPCCSEFFDSGVTALLYNMLRLNVLSIIVLNPQTCLRLHVQPTHEAAVRERPKLAIVWSRVVNHHALILQSFEA